MKELLIITLFSVYINAKTFEDYTKTMKIISDSKIYVDKNNLLYSSSPIYGRFYSNSHLAFLNNGINNIRCDLKNHFYNVVDECSMVIQNSYLKSNKVFLGKMDSLHINEFNYKTHMIECKYDKDHGVMHNCQIKIYKYL